MKEDLLATLEKVCRENYEHWPDSPYGQSALISDERAAQHNGARIHDVMRAMGTRAEAGTPAYRRTRAALERFVRDGLAVAHRASGGGYVWYWPKGLSQSLTLPA